MHVSREPRAPVATGALYVCGVPHRKRIIYTSRQLRDMYLSMIRGRFNNKARSQEEDVRWRPRGRTIGNSGPLRERTQISFASADYFPDARFVPAPPVVDRL